MLLVLPKPKLGHVNLLIVTISSRTCTKPHVGGRLISHLGYKLLIMILQEKSKNKYQYSVESKHQYGVEFTNITNQNLIKIPSGMNLSIQRVNEVVLAKIYIEEKAVRRLTISIEDLFDIVEKYTKVQIRENEDITTLYVHQ